MTMATLADVATIHGGGRLGLSGSDFVDSGVPAYGAAGRNGYVATAEYENRDAVILSSIGARCGKCFFVRGRWTSLANTQVILPDEAKADPRFLWFQLNDERRWHRSGSAQPFIKPSDVKAHRIFLPPLSEQRRIAAILDHADELRAKRRQVLARLDSLSQSIFQSTIGASRWPVEKLGERLDFLTSGSRGWAKYYVPSGAKFIRIQNVKNGYLNQDDMAYVNAPRTAEAKRTVVREGDVLLSITADLGRTAVVPDGIGEAYINQHLAILRAPSLDPRYLADFLASPAGRREVIGKDRGATKAGLNFDDVRSVAVPIPSREIQRNYASRIAQVNTQRAAMQRAIAADDELFASLQARAFRGEL